MTQDQQDSAHTWGAIEANPALLAHFKAMASDTLDRPPGPPLTPESFCRAQYEPTDKALRWTTHTCAWFADHDGPHRCPHCGNEWSSAETLGQEDETDG